ncbi:MAG: RHS repeat-associated core domain-containing protein [Chloroflexaceae bacterium]
MREHPTPIATDASGAILWAHDGLGRSVYSYDAAGRLAGVLYPDGRSLALRYDAAGRPLERARAHGSERYRYDPAGRLLQVAYPDGLRYDYRYDAAGRLVAVGDPATSFAYGDGPLPERITQVIDGATYHSELRYDAAGRLVAACVPGFASWLRYRYDARGRLAALGYDGAEDLACLSYADQEPQLSIRFANGLVQRQAVSASGFVKQIRVEAPDGAALLDLRYRHDPRAGVSALNERRYRYDARGRLVAHGPLLSVWTRYEYDAAGNRIHERRPDGTTLSYRYDVCGRLLSRYSSDGATLRFRHDSAGNLVEQVDDAGQRRRYHFDAAGRLTMATLPAGDPARYQYDQNGRLLQAKHAGSHRLMHRDPWGHLLAEQVGEETRVYLGPPGQPLVCLVLRAGEVTPLFLHHDHLGSLRLASDASGQPVARFDYDPWGNLEHGAGPAWLRWFAGHRYDATLGLYEAGVRWYDPQLGRFISADSYSCGADDPRLLWSSLPEAARAALRAARLRAWAQHDGLQSRYIYARNNPLTFVDRDGHNAGLYFLYSLSAIFWALPYTLVGFVLFELLFNWITFAFLWSGDYELSGQSSDRLGAWAIWSAGGLSGKMVIGSGAFTLGNWVIANGPFWNGLDDTVASFAIPNRPGDLDPLNTGALITERRAIVEHELRHTNQYGWWGPFMMPWVLIFYLIIFVIGFSIDATGRREGFAARWRTLFGQLTDEWWKIVIEGVALLLLPGAYWWDYIGRGGYGSSWFEQDAAQNSGASNNINIRLAASADRVAPGGTAIISLITDPNLLAGATLTISSNASGATLVELPLNPPVTNLRAFRYTAGPTAGTDVLTGNDGTSTTLELRVQ